MNYIIVLAIVGLFAGTLVTYPNSVNAEPFFEVVCAQDELLSPPSEDTPLHYAIVENLQIVKHGVVNDDQTGHDLGWDPNGVDRYFQITDSQLNPETSAVFINTSDDQSYSVCFVDWISDSDDDAAQGKLSMSNTKHIKTTSSSDNSTTMK